MIESEYPKKIIEAPHSWHGVPSQGLPQLHPALLALNRVHVSRFFRKAAADAFPVLKTNRAYWMLFCYLLFGYQHDRQTKRLLLCADILSDIEGRDRDNSQAQNFLIRFQEDVLFPNAGLNWTAGWYRKKCRQLRRLDLGKFQEVLRGEYLGWWNESGIVYLVDGSVCNTAKGRKLRREQRDYANRLPTLCEHADNIRSYMNALRPNRFTRTVAENLHSARKAVFNLPEGRVKDAQFRILRHIESQPQSFYFPSADGNTVRLNTSEAIPNLKSNVRRALTKGWEEADLRSSQFAICASLWQVPELLDFLKSGKSLWPHLLDYLGIPDEAREQAKPALKKVLYAMCFGMERPRLKALAAYRLVVAGLNKALFRTLQEEPLIVALLNARDIALERIAADGGAYTCYDQWKSVTEERKPRDIMAEIAQAWEMKLIYPAFELANTTRAFVITLYQYDGFSVVFRHRKEQWKERIEQAIQDNADSLNILTKLEWS